MDSSEEAGFGVAVLESSRVGSVTGACPKDGPSALRFAKVMAHCHR